MAGSGAGSEASREQTREQTRELPELTSDRHGGGRVLFWLVVLVGLALACTLGVRVAGFWPTWTNPFAEQETDRSQPPVLLSLQDLSRYVAAEGTYQVVIDLQRNRAWVPDFLLNERTLLVAVGTVDGYVDFTGLTEDAITVSEDGTAVTVRLPAPELGEPNLDLDASYVFAEQRGVLNRIGEIFGGDPNRQREVYQRAEADIAAAATASGLRERTQENTGKMLDGLLRSLGFTEVRVTFAQP